jgi:hypothetical protein
MNTPKPRTHNEVASDAKSMPKLATTAALIIALRSPKMLIKRAAGMSAKSVPIITSPRIIPAVGNDAPKAWALAGMIGSSPPSAIPKSSEGVNTGKPRLVSLYEDAGT